MSQKNEQNLFEAANADFSASRKFMYLTLALAVATVGVHESPLFFGPVLGATALSLGLCFYKAISGAVKNHTAMERSI